MKDPTLYVYEIIAHDDVIGKKHYAVAATLSFAVDQFEAVTEQQALRIECLGKDTLRWK